MLVHNYLHRKINVSNTAVVSGVWLVECIERWAEEIHTRGPGKDQKREGLDSTKHGNHTADGKGEQFEEASGAISDGKNDTVKKSMEGTASEGDSGHTTGNVLNSYGDLPLDNLYRKVELVRRLMAEHKLGQRRLGERTGVRASQVFNYLHRKLKGDTSLHVAQKLEQWALEMENHPVPGSPIAASPAKSAGNKVRGRTHKNAQGEIANEKADVLPYEDETEDMDSPVSTYKEYRGTCMRE